MSERVHLLPPTPLAESTHVQADETQVFMWSSSFDVLPGSRTRSRSSSRDGGGGGHDKVERASSLSRSRAGPGSSANLTASPLMMAHKKRSSTNSFMGSLGGGGGGGGSGHHLKVPLVVLPSSRVDTITSQAPSDSDSGLSPHKTDITISSGQRELVEVVMFDQGEFTLDITDIKVRNRHPMRLHLVVRTNSTWGIPMIRSGSVMTPPPQERLVWEEECTFEAGERKSFSLTFPVHDNASAGTTMPESLPHTHQQQHRVCFSIRIALESLKPPSSSSCGCLPWLCTPSPVTLSLLLKKSAMEKDAADRRGILGHMIRSLESMLSMPSGSGGAGGIVSSSLNNNNNNDAVQTEDGTRLPSIPSGAGSDSILEHHIDDPLLHASKQPVPPHNKSSTSLAREIPESTEDEITTTTTTALYIDGALFRESATGRVVTLRGLNVSGNAKMPVGDTTQVPRFGADAYATARHDITFVGRPFPLAEAGTHLARIVGWGFNTIRFLITWEAVAHAGPKQFDSEYLDYVEKIVRLAAGDEFKLYVFIDCHQDVWSRFTGGSGAPAWTLELAGLDMNKLETHYACFTHARASPGGDTSKFQRMTWPQNYQRFACLHMFTLFFGGKEFAPEFYVKSNWCPGDAICETSPDDREGIHIQDFLQNHFVAMWIAVMKRFHDVPRVLGFDAFNEPSCGMIGMVTTARPYTVIPPGLVFTPLSGWALARGLPCDVGYANALGWILHTKLVKPPRADDGKNGIWLPGRTDIWERTGVFAIKHGIAQAARPQHFCRSNVKFFRDLLAPFLMRIHATLEQQVGRELLCFAEGEAFGHPEFEWPPDGMRGVVNATHWYDGATLFLRRFSPLMTLDTKTAWPVLGRDAMFALHRRDLRNIINLPRSAIDGQSVLTMPTLLGEFGVPYDLNDKIGFRRNDFSAHEVALSMYYDLFDELQISSTQWNYTPENSNAYGDHWNLEDLSVWSPDQGGARAIKGFSRPYAPVVGGDVKLVRFVGKRGTREAEFTLRYLPSLSNFKLDDDDAATIIYLPEHHFPFFEVTIISGTVKFDRLQGMSAIRVWAMQSSRVVSQVDIVVTAHDGT